MAPDVTGSVDDILEALLTATGASRVTLRQDLPGDYAFPVTHEALADGVSSLRRERTVDLRTQPVVLELQKGRQVVQDDCRDGLRRPGVPADARNLRRARSADRDAGLRR